MKIAFLALCLLLAGCPSVSPPSTIPLGAVTEPPFGWVNYCLNHPDREECK